MKSDFLKKNWYYFAPAILLLIPVIMLAFYTTMFGYSFSESWNAVTHMGSSSTRYATNYQERNFDKLRVGMDGRTVFESLGSVPLERRLNDAEWYFSFPAGNATCHHERMLYLEKDKDGVPRVTRIVKRFHMPETK